MAPESLIRDDSEPAPPTEQGDTAILGAVLFDLGVQTRISIVAQCLGWDLPRAHAAAQALKPILAPAGLTVHQRSGKISLVTSDDRFAAYVVAIKRHPLTNYTQRFLTASRARLVWAALNDRLRQNTLSDMDRNHVGSLVRTGYLALAKTEKVLPSDEVLRCLYPPQDAAPPAAASPTQDLAG